MCPAVHGNANYSVFLRKSKTAHIEMEQDILVILIGIAASKGRKSNLIDKGVTFVRRFFYYTYNKCNSFLFLHFYHYNA